MAEAVPVIGVGQFVDIVDVGRDQRAQVGDPAHLLRRRHAEMLDGEAVVQPRPLELEFLQHVERQLQPHVAGAVDVDAEALVPEGAGQRLDLFRRHQPFAVMAIYEAGRLELHQLGVEAAVGEQLDAVAELQPVRAARRHLPDPRDLRRLVARRGAAFGRPRDHLAAEGDVGPVEHRHQRRPFHLQVGERHRHVADGGVAAGMDRAGDLLQPAEETLRCVEIALHAVERDGQAGLVEPPGFRIDLLVARQLVPVQAHPVDGGVVGDNLVERALPDEDRPGLRDAVERPPVDRAVPDLVIAPGDQRLAGIGDLRVDRLEAVEIGVVALDRRGHSAGQPPFHRRDEVAGQQDRRQRRMQMRVDETRHQHAVAERVVDPVRMRVQPGLQRFERADLDNPVAAHRNGCGNG